VAVGHAQQFVQCFALGAERGDERALLQIRLLISPDLQIGVPSLLAR
jgi:hypothetical protein